MDEWWTYRPRDFLLFSPRTYWRLFELENQAVWPLQILVLLLGAAILVSLFRPRAWADRAIAGTLAAAWVFVGLNFVWMRYAPINWAAAYLVPAFLAEALLLLWFGALRHRLRFAAKPGLTGAVGLGLYLYALALHPLVAPGSGRPLTAAELVGIAPDPTAIATLGLLTLGARGANGLLPTVVPYLWCIATAITLRTMGEWEGWIPLAAAGLALLGQIWAARRSRT